MKFFRKILGIAVIIAVVGFAFFACDVDGGGGGGGGSGGDDDDSLFVDGEAEQKPVKDRWRKWEEETSTAQLTYEVDDDGVCKITVKGTVQQNIWNVSAQYDYTGNAGKKYEYTFEAWTESGEREFNLQYYTDYIDNEYLSKRVSITSEPKKYTVYGEALPKNGYSVLEFQCANQLGTFFVKNIEIKKYTTGEITITNIPDNNPFSGGFSNVFGQASLDNGSSLIFAVNLEETEDGGILISSAQVNGSTMTIPVWLITQENGKQKIAPFNGNGTVNKGNLTFEQTFFSDGQWGENGWTGDEPTVVEYVNKVPITFNNGSANINATQMKLSTEPDTVEDDRWWKWVDDANNTTNLTYSVGNDGVCTINVTGTPVSEAWRSTVGYGYTAIEGKNYEYTFMAWTDSGTRDLHLQYYEDNDKGIWLNTTFQITTEQKTYTVRGREIPEDRAESLRFQSADAIGTYHVKIIEIKEFVIGKLTVTNLPNNPFPNGSSVVVGDAYNLGNGSSSQLQFIFLDEINGGGTFVPVNGNSAILPVWEITWTSEGEATFAPFKENVTIKAGDLVFQQNYFGGSGEWIDGNWTGDVDFNRFRNTSPIIFKNGNATINFATQMETLYKDKLTYTNWTLTTDTHIIIQFDFEKVFIAWEDREDGYWYSLINGTYTISGNSVIFSYQEWENGDYKDKTITGTLSGNSLTVPGYGTFIKQ